MVSFFDIPWISQTRLSATLIPVDDLITAGAGPTWSYHRHSTGEKISRSEGLAVASLEMFKDGLFSDQKEGEGRCRATCKPVLNLLSSIISLTIALFDP